MNQLKTAVAALSITVASVGSVNAHSVSAAVLPFSGVTLDGGASAAGTGIAIEGTAGIHGPIFAFGEIARRTYSGDLRGLNFDNYRAGLGWAFQDSPLYIGINAEQYRQVTAGVGSTMIGGGGIRVGTRTPIGQSAAYFNAELAASAFENDLKIYEGNIGVGAYITDSVSIYGSYRITYLDQSNPSGHASVDDVRTGFRFDF